MTHRIGLVPTDILLPGQDADLSRWACAACDQYTSQPEYWAETARYVGNAPSTLNLMLPECYLSQSGERTPVIHQNMRDYLTDGVLRQAVAEGFVLVERTTESGARVGLLAAVDLEEYDYTRGSLSLIRPTEETIAARLPARLAIRRGAPLELTHILLLMDDPQKTVLEPLYARREMMKRLYDFPLMMGGGHLRGWAVENDADKTQIETALTALKNGMGEHPLLFAVGDGNHSLATAKAAWEEIKPTLTAEERERHPARYALCEVENIHDGALVFEPIHRILTGVAPNAVWKDWQEYCERRGMTLRSADAAAEGEQSVRVISGGAESVAVIGQPDGALTVDTLQRYLDDFLRRNPEARLDYIHGDDVLRGLAAQPDSMGFLLPVLDKAAFFPAIRRLGVLPRKTFSMGAAHEKRFYMECRRIEG